MRALDMLGRKATGLAHERQAKAPVLDSMMIGLLQCRKTIGATLYRYGRAVWLRLAAPFVRRSVTIALANQPRLLRDMLCRLIEDEPGLRVVIATGDPKKLLRALNRGWVDWVVTMADSLPLQAAARANSRKRGLALMVLSHDAQTAEVTIPAANGQLLHQVFSNLTLDQLFAILRHRDLR